MNRQAVRGALALNLQANGMKVPTPGAAALIKKVLSEHAAGQQEFSTSEIMRLKQISADEYASDREYWDRYG
jgi:hypothetical protein